MPSVVLVYPGIFLKEIVSRVYFVMEAVPKASPTLICQPCCAWERQDWSRVSERGQWVSVCLLGTTDATYSLSCLHACALGKTPAVTLGCFSTLFRLVFS